MRTEYYICGAVYDPFEAATNKRLVDLVDFQTGVIVENEVRNQDAGLVGCETVKVGDMCQKRLMFVKL